jgi:predicted 3-demethylubiquinone-9 3-methyltransferase (glyoxalase superfamily)
MSITPFLWFEDNAEQAIEFYVSLFPGSKIKEVSRWGDGAPLPKGTLMSATFELEGRSYMALNGGPTYRLNPAFSLFVSCDTQEEVDALWGKLIARGGEEQPCGWLKDRFGLSWQIIPKTLVRLMSDPDRQKAGRVVQAMLKMKKIDIAALETAYRG